MKKIFVLDEFDLEKIWRHLSSIGATSSKILDEGFRSSLLKEAEGYAYKPEKEIVGRGNRIVRQHMGSFDEFPSGSKYVLLRKTFQALLDARLAGSAASSFAAPVNLDSMVLQKYEEGSLGITPHRDRSVYVNLVCIFCIGGRGKFHICSDRAGSDAREIDASPGRVILMRAPGFLGSKERAFHCVTDIQETRYTLGLRQTQCRNPGKAPEASMAS